MNCEIAGWENWSSNTSAPLFWGDYDFTFKHYLHLKEGYIFDGNGFEIRMDHSSFFPGSLPSVSGSSPHYSNKYGQS